MPHLVYDSEYERSYPGNRRGCLIVKADGEASHDLPFAYASRDE